jgi:hypothetical protein
MTGPAEPGTRQAAQVLAEFAHPAADLSRKRIQRRPVLGGLINEYERAA